MRNNLYCILAMILSFIIIYPVSGYAEKITLKEYLKGLIENDEEYKNISANLKKIEGDIISAETIYDLNLSGQLSKTMLAITR
ncbi:MAG: hypothetical protein GY730_07260 [bacterium]|nr:hypothetical protein [bacterium]